MNKLNNNNNGNFVPVKDLQDKTYQLRKDINNIDENNKDIKTELYKYVDKTMENHTKYVNNKYYNKAQINNIIITHSGIELDDYYNKIEADERFETKEHLENYYNKTETDNKFETKEHLTSNYYNKGETDNKFESKEDLLTGITTNALTLNNNNITIIKDATDTNNVEIPTLKLCDNRYITTVDLDSKYVLKAGETLDNTYNFTNGNNKFKGTIVLGNKEINNIETIENDTNKLISNDKVNLLLEDYVNKNSSTEQTINGQIRLNNVSAFTLPIL